jgi:hypothetical protein
VCICRIANALHGDVPLLEAQCRHCSHGEVIDLAEVIWPRESIGFWRKRVNPEELFGPCSSKCRGSGLQMEAGHSNSDIPDIRRNACISLAKPTF